MLLFHFTDANSSDTAGNFSAVITWGDGATSTVTSTLSAGGQIVANPNGGFDVLGSHLYAQQLSGATFSVTVSASDGANTGASQTSFTVGNTVTSAVATGSLALANDASIIIAAGGTLTISTGVTLSSGATVVVDSGGTLVLSALDLGGGAGGVTLNGGTLEAAANLITAVPVTIGAGDATIDTNGFDVTLSGNLIGGAGSGTLTETGGGTLTLSGSSTFTGGTVVSSGKLVMDSPGTQSSSGEVNVSRPGTVDLTSQLDAYLGSQTPPVSSGPIPGATSNAATTTAATSTAPAAATTSVPTPTTTATVPAGVTSAGPAPAPTVSPPPAAKATTVKAAVPSISATLASLIRPAAVASRPAVTASGALTAGPASAHDAVLQSRQVTGTAVAATTSLSLRDRFPPADRQEGGLGGRACRCGLGGLAGLSGTGDCPNFRGHHAEHGRENGTVLFTRGTCPPCVTTAGPAIL